MMLRENEERLYPSTSSYYTNLICIVGAYISILFLLGMIFFTNFYGDIRSWEWWSFLSITLACGILISSALYNGVRNPHLFLNKKENYIHCGEIIIPIEKIMSCTWIKEPFSFRNSSWARRKYSLNLKDNNFVIFYGYYRGCESEVVEQLKKIGIDVKKKDK